MELAEKLINALKSRISRKNWEMWFGTFNVESVTDTLITFSVGNLFIKDWIDQKYAKHFKEAIRELTGKDVPYTIKDEMVEEVSRERDVKKERLIRKRPVVLSRFNKEYTFESFVVGLFNEEAYEGALEIAKTPGKMNPFFLYGGVGLGKTHLLNSIGNYILENSPDTHVMYVTAEKFMNDLVMAIKSGTTGEFRKNFRDKIDVLMIDDVQFLIGKNGIQSELFHTLNHFIDSCKQIILCSDRTPAQLTEFQPRLVSRFQMGLMVKVNDPDTETEKRIVKAFARKSGIELTDEMIRQIVEYADNIRTIKGIMTKISFKNSKNGVDDSTITKTISEVVGTSISPLMVKDKNVEKELLFQALSTVFDVKPAELDARLRTARLSSARQVGMFFARKYMGKTFAEIGEWFGRDHSSVVYACKKVNDSMKKGNTIIKRQITHLQELLHLQSGASVS